MIEATLRDWHQRTELNWGARPIHVECVRHNTTDQNEPSLYLLLTDDGNNRIVVVFDERQRQRLTRELTKAIPHPHSGKIPR